MNQNPNSLPQQLSFPLFQNIQLPPIQLLNSYQLSIDCTKNSLESVLPPFVTFHPAVHPRGAPVKLKNTLIDYYNIKNTKGKRFKFSFIPQILIAHLQHLFGVKKKSRYKKREWLRLYSPQGQALCRSLTESVGDNIGIFEFKRTISLKELKYWLNGEIYSESSGLSSRVLSQKRIEVFREFCILKCIDLESQYANDFSVQPGAGTECEVFRTYITKTMWEEIGLICITEEEIYDTIHSV